MPQFKLYTGPVGRYYFFEKEIKERVRNGQNDWLYILPVNRALRLFNRQLIDIAPGKILAAVPLYTFDSLLMYLYNQLPGTGKVVSSELVSLLVEEILKKNSARFTYFPVAKNGSTRLFRKIADMVTELRRFGYDADELAAKNIAKWQLSDDKRSDFVLVLKELDVLLGHDFIDADSARHKAALEITPEIFKACFPDVRQVFIGGYGLFTPAMYLLIQKVLQVADVDLKLDYQPGNTLLFEHTQPAFEQLKEMGATVIQSDEKSYFARHLFNREFKSPRPDESNRITLTACENRSAEVQNIVTKIRDLQESEHVPLNKCAVTFSNLESYVPAIRKVFREHGIPFNLSTGYSLKQSPLVATFINLLEAVGENFEYSLVFHLYQSPFLLNTRSTPPVMLYKRIVEKRLRYLTQNAFARREYLSSGDDKKDENLNKEIDRLTKFLQPFYTFGTQDRTADEFHRDFRKLMRESGALHWYKGRPSTVENERLREHEYRAYNRFMKLIEQFVWSMRQLYGSEKIELSVFATHLYNAVARATYNLTEWSVNAVQIMPRLEIQALDYDVLFLGGLIDGDFPRASAKDIFFKDEDRKRLGLVASEELLDQDRFMFYSLLDSGAQRLFFSYPRYEGEKTLVPSTFLADLQETVVVGREERISSTAQILTPVSLTQAWQEWGLALQNFDQQRERLMELTAVLAQSAVQNIFYIKQLLQRIAAGRERLTLLRPPGMYEGILSSREAITREISEEYNGHEWSVTQLEEFAFCPMKFFLKRILRLKEWPEFEEEVNPLERGNVVHTIFYRFYSELRNRNAADRPAAYRELLELIAREELERLPFDGFFWALEKMRYFGSDEGPGLLEKFLQLDQQEIDATGFIPAHFEFSFGKLYDKGVTDPFSVREPLEIRDAQGVTVLLNGKIDRVDINPRSKQAIVLDYKTGNIGGKTINAIVEGHSFQLPLYILAIEHFLKDTDAVYGGYYQVKDADNCQRKAALGDRDKYPFAGTDKAALPRKSDPEKTMDWVINNTRDLALQKINDLNAVSFNHTLRPADKGCSSYCEYKRMCQKHVAKLKALGSLEQDEDDE